MPLLLFSLFGTLSSLIMIPIGFAIGVYVPLVVSDTAYTIYNTLGMNNFARELFGSSDGYGVDWTSTLGQFFMWVLIISVAALAVVVLTRAVSVWFGSGKRWSVSVGRLTYGILGVVLAPLIFMFTVTITSLLFQLMSPDSARMSLEEQGKMIAALGIYSRKISIIAGSSITVEGITYSYEAGIDELIKKMTALQAMSANVGYTEASNEANSIIEMLARAKALGGNYVPSVLNEMISTVGSVKPGTRISDISSLQSEYNRLTEAVQTYDAGVTAAINFSSNYSGHRFVGDPNYVWINEYATQVSPEDATAYYNSFSSVFSDKSFAGSDAQLSLINQVITGGSRPYYLVTSGFTGIDLIYAKLNPLPSFGMTRTIYYFVTGNNSNNVSFGTLIGSGIGAFFGRIDKYVIGILSANIAMGAMMAYCYYVISRIFELAFFWMVSIYIAFTDDSENSRFKTCVLMICSKTFSIVVVQFVFTAVNAILNTGTVQGWVGAGATGGSGWFDAGKAAVMLTTVIAFALSFPISDALCGLIFREPGKLRSIQDQYHYVMGTGRQQYGQQSSARIGGGLRGVQNIAQSAWKGFSRQGKGK